MGEILQFPYKVKPTWMLLGIALFGTGAVSLAHAALTNDRGLILNEAITFSVKGATIFYWSTTAVCGLFVIAGIAGLVATLTHPMKIQLTETELSTPRHVFVRKPSLWIS